MNINQALETVVSFGYYFIGKQHTNGIGFTYHFLYNDQRRTMTADHVIQFATALVA